METGEPKAAAAHASQSPSTSSRMSRRRRKTEGAPPLERSEGAPLCKRRRAPAGRIIPPREQNGRFMKAPTSSKCAGKPLSTTTTIRSESPANDAEAYTHITNSSESFSASPALTDRNLVADTSSNTFITPLPSELVNIIFNHSILPHLKSSSQSELQMLVCENRFMNHYRPQLLNFLTLAFKCTGFSICTYKNIQSVVCAAMRSLGF